VNLASETRKENRTTSYLGLLYEDELHSLAPLHGDLWEQTSSIPVPAASIISEGLAHRNMQEQMTTEIELSQTWASAEFLQDESSRNN
jgi:hypothetical protein